MSDFNVLNESIILLKIKEKIKNNIFVEKCLEDINYSDCFVVGLPENIDVSVINCIGSVAFVYTLLEYGHGSRIKNKNILYLINMIGLKQIRDIIKYITFIKYIVISGSNKCTIEIKEKLERKCDIERVEKYEISHEKLANALFNIATSRVRRIVK